VNFLSNFDFFFLLRYYTLTFTHKTNGIAWQTGDGRGGGHKDIVLQSFKCRRMGVKMPGDP